jgi:hypothetical protein
MPHGKNVGAMKGGDTGDVQNPFQDDAGQPLGNGPVGMEDVRITSFGGYSSTYGLGEKEKRDLQTKRSSLPDVLNDARAIAEFLKMKRKEIGETKYCEIISCFNKPASLIMGRNHANMDIFFGQPFG